MKKEVKNYNYWTVMTGRVNLHQSDLYSEESIMDPSEKNDIFKFILNRSIFRMMHPDQILTLDEIEFLSRNGVSVPVEEKLKTKSVDKR